jgi:S-methylmethionine-dependent homocysteine/selenocysteine methylase
MVQQRPDFLALETIPCLDEVRALQKALGKISEENQMPVAWMTVACNSPHTLNSGENIEDFCRIMEDSEVASSPRNCLIGVNCTHPHYIDDILQLMTDSTSKQRRFIAYPNRGDGWNECLHCYENDPGVCINLDNQFVAESRLWVERYPQLCILGGCCRTHPNLIRRLKEGLQGCYRRK